MMNTNHYWVIGALLALSTLQVHATLIDRGRGLIYDSSQNITWLQDAKYARTSGYTTDGAMTWYEAKQWAADLVYQGYDDWRLPTMLDFGAPGCSGGFGGDPDCRYNPDPARSEMAHLFFTDLGNLAAFDLNGVFRGGKTGVTFGVVHSDPFINMQTEIYWGYWIESIPSLPATFNDAWTFWTFDGSQSMVPKDKLALVWAVRDGNVTGASEPFGLALLCLGLAILRVTGFGERRA